MNTKRAPKAIWIVEDGEYSDYRVLGFYSTKAKAETARRLWKADSIREVEMNEMPPHPKGMVFWCVEMQEDGTTGDIEQESARYADAYLANGEWRPHGDGIHVCFYHWARNEKHAIKIANEHRIALKASGQWTADWDKWKESLAASQP